MVKLPTKTKSIIRVLECLGFRLDVGSGRGDHYKYIHSSKKPVVSNQPPFIMIPKHPFDHGKLNEIIKSELTAFGFSKDEIKRCC